MLIYLWTSSLSLCQHSSLCAFCGSVSPLPPTVKHHTGDISVITSPSPEEQHAQAFEEMGFSGAQAPFISQELLLTVRDAHWSWRPLRENAFEKKKKRAKAQKSPSAFPLHGSRHSIDSVSLAQHWCGLMPLCFFSALFFHLLWLQHNTISDAQFPLLPFTFCIITSLDGRAVKFTDRSLHIQVLFLTTSVFWKNERPNFFSLSAIYSLTNQFRSGDNSYVL